MPSTKGSALLILWCWLLTNFAYADTPLSPKLIVNISSYHKGYQWSDNTDKGIRQILGEGHNQVVTLYLDTKRLGKNSFRESAKKIETEITRLHPDLLMLGDDNALSLLADYAAQTQTPTVFYGINTNPRNYFPARQRPINMTGITERVPVVPLLRIIDSILPGTRSVLVLSDGSLSGKALKEMRLYQKDRLKVGKSTVKFHESSDWSEWQSLVSQAHLSYDAIALVGYHSVRDANGVIDYMQNIRWTAKQAQLPIFTIQNHVGEELATGALALDGVKHGRHAAKIALQLLDGAAQPSTLSIKSEAQDATLVFSQRNLERHKISLPKRIRNSAILAP